MEGNIPVRFSKESNAGVRGAKRGKRNNKVSRDKAEQTRGKGKAATRGGRHNSKLPQWETAPQRAHASTPTRMRSNRQALIIHDVIGQLLYSRDFQNKTEGGVFHKINNVGQEGKKQLVYAIALK